MNLIVSVIIPFYCTPIDLFTRCINSILSSESDDFEIVIVNDGSPEEYNDILLRYSADDRVFVVNNDKKGVSSARNYGMSIARGKWIMFVDSDDYVDTTVFDSILETADNYNADILILNGSLDSNGIIKKNTLFLSEGVDYSDTDDKRIMLLESAITVGILPYGYIQSFSLGAPYCKLINTSFLENNNIKFNENVRFAEDTLLSIDLYSKANGIYYIDKYLYFYVRNQYSVTSKYRPGLSKDMDCFFEHLEMSISNLRYADRLNYAYYVRVQFEIGRCFNNEFFHFENRNNYKTAYLHFISKEPYKTALNLDYLKSKGIMSKIRKYLIKSGHGNLYKWWKIATYKQILSFIKLIL